MRRGRRLDRPPLGGEGRACPLRASLLRGEGRAAGEGTTQLFVAIRFYFFFEASLRTTSILLKYNTFFVARTLNSDK